MCYPPDWTTCLFPVFHHVAIDCAIQRLGTLEGKDVTGCIELKTPKVLKVGVHIDRRIPEDTCRRIFDFG